VRGASLSVRAGEIVGLAGVAGNGQRELIQVITGLRKCSRGDIRLLGVDICNQPADVGIRLGMSHIPEDRTHVGTAPNLSITDNLIMKKYRQPPIAHGWVMDRLAANKMANELRETYDIVVPTIETPVRLLSGGNLQRVILAREISGQPKLMVAMQPTRGLDVGAIEGVHRLLLAQRQSGAAILLVSEELEELISLSDRIFVIYEGQIMGEVAVNLPSGDSLGAQLAGDSRKLIDTIGLMMTGTPLDQIQKGML
jgi:ABC-type uncharacterized transport system ATPase subunit